MIRAAKRGKSDQGGRAFKYQATELYPLMANLAFWNIQCIPPLNILAIPGQSRSVR